MKLNKNKINFINKIIFNLIIFLLNYSSVEAQTSSNYSQIYNEFPPNNISLTELSNEFNVSQELEDKFRKTNQNFAVFNESKVILICF